MDAPMLSFCAGGSGEGGVGSKNSSKLLCIMDNGESIGSRCEGGRLTDGIVMMDRCVDAWRFGSGAGVAVEGCFLFFVGVVFVGVVLGFFGKGAGSICGSREGKCEISDISSSASMLPFICF